MVPVSKFVLWCCVFLISLLGTTVVHGFSDVPATHPYQQGIAYVQQRGIVGGYEDGTYRPANPINRAEFTKIIIAAQFPESIIEDCVRLTAGASTTYVFKDVAREAWYAPYVCVAHTNGIIEGYADGTFRPEQLISFVEAAKIIVMTFGYPTTPNKEVWYEPFVRKLEERGAIPTSIASFEHQLSRGEMAETVYRLMAQLRQLPSVSYQELASPQQSSQGAPLAITMTWEEMKSDQVRRHIEDTGVGTVIIEVGVDQLLAKDWYTHWSAMKLAKSIEPRLLVRMAPVDCTEEWSACVEPWSIGSDITAVRVALATVMGGWPKEHRPAIAYTDPGLEQLVGIDPIVLLEVPYIMQAMAQGGTQVYLTRRFNPLEYNNAYQQRFSSYGAGIAYTMFPSAFGELSREEVWGVVESWLSAAVDSTSGAIHIVGIGFPAAVPYGTPTMQQHFAELVRLYGEHYGDDIGVISWYGLYDRPSVVDPYFSSMGLRTMGGTRPALTEWK